MRDVHRKTRGLGGGTTDTFGHKTTGIPRGGGTAETLHDDGLDIGLLKPAWAAC